MKNTKEDFEDVSPLDFLDLACELDEIKEKLTSPNPIINRTIYMRIYYAVFLFLREWLKRFTKYHSPRGEHTKLPKYIKNNGPFSEKINNEIYYDLLLLKKLRHQADYKLIVPTKYSKNYQKWNFTNIKSSFRIAENIIKIFNEYKNF